MKKITYRLIIIVVFLSLFVTPAGGAAKSTPAQPLSQASLGPVRLQGRVIHAPVGAKVQAFDAGGVLVAEAYAGPQGRFAFEPLPAGQYHLLVVDAQGQRLPSTVDSQAEVPLESGAVRREYVLRVVTPPGKIPTPAEAAGIRAAFAGTGQITGTVSAAAGGAPLEDAVVYVYTSKTADWWEYVTFDYTDAAGVYALTGLADGSYYVRFVNNDYVTEYYNDKSSLLDANAVNVALGGVTAGVNASLVLGGRITGTVTGAGGAPLESAVVYAYTSKTAEEWDYAGYDDTDASGVYAITGLPTGTYYLSIEKSDYLTEYYNDKASLALANGVSVTLGAETPGINAALTLGGKITGIVAAVGGAPLGGAQVYAYTSKTADVWDYVTNSSTDAAGTYALTGLSTGTYYLRFVNSDYLTEYYNDKASLALANGVSVTLGGVTSGINAALTLGGKITGTVTAAAGGAFLSGAYAYVYTSKTAEPSDYVANDATDASGAYALTGLPAGTYYLRFTKTDYLTTFYNGKSSLADADGVAVTLGGVTGGINAALPAGGRISGLVIAEENSAALENVNVNVFSYIKRCGRWQLSFLTSTVTDAAGHYIVKSLGTGDYIVQFDPPSYGFSAAYLPQFFNNQETVLSAYFIHVIAGQTSASINAVLTKGGTITGVVTAASGGAALKDINVEAYTTSGNRTANAVTDASGAYTITGLPAGDYKLDFYPSWFGASLAYIMEYYNNQSTWSSADSVTVPAGGLVSGKNAALALGGQFTGQVTAADGGAPLQYVYVDVYDSLGQYKVYTTTDSNGIYTTPGLAAGSYKLDFDPYSGSAEAYMQEYYNDKTTLANADPISLVAPGLTTANAVVARGGSIGGTVTSSITSGPLKSVEVDLIDSNGEDIDWEYTDENGHYLFQGLPAGVYRVYFLLSVCGLNFDTYYHQKATLAAADHVSVTVPVLTPNIDAQLNMPAVLEIQQCFLPLIKR